MTKYLPYLPILAPDPDQNHPFSFGGCKSGRSHPAKLHLRPDVQMYRTFPREILCLINSFSFKNGTKQHDAVRILFSSNSLPQTLQRTCGVSNETASIQWRRQILRASSQSTSSVRVGWCSQLKKYEWATPRASRYVAWRTPNKHHVIAHFQRCRNKSNRQEIDERYEKCMKCTMLSYSGKNAERYRSRKYLYNPYRHTQLL